jgi:hypothetical protein
MNTEDNNAGDITYLENLYSTGLQFSTNVWEMCKWTVLNNSKYSSLIDVIHIVMLVTINRVWIDNWIYCDTYKL